MKPKPRRLYKVGRPRSDVVRDRRVSVAVTEDELGALVAEAREDEVSASEFVRQLLAAELLRRDEERVEGKMLRRSARINRSN